jgi:hypothetical protein
LDRWKRLKNLVIDKINDWYAEFIAKRHAAIDSDFLYRRIHPEWRQSDGSISSAAFGNFDMSVDLASLTTPYKSWKRAGNQDFGVVRLSVQTMRTLPLPQEVKHWPTILNYSHTLVLGEKQAKGKMKRKIAKTAIILIDTAPYRASPPQC